MADTELSLFQAAGSAAAFGGTLHSKMLETGREFVMHSQRNVISKMVVEWNRNEQEYMARVDQRAREQEKRAGKVPFYDPFCLPVPFTMVSSCVAALMQLWRERRPRFPLRPRNADQELPVRQMEVLLDYQCQRSRLDREQHYRYIIAKIYGYAPRKTYWDEKLQCNITRAWDPYSFFWDPYCRVDNVHDGKFVAFQATEHIVRLRRAGTYFNLDKINQKVDSGFVQMFGFGVERDMGYKGGTQRDELMGIDEPSSFRSFGLGAAHHIIHEVCFWMTPSEWFKDTPVLLPEMNPEQPVIARLTIANGQTVIGFDYLDGEDKFPAGVIAPLADGLITVPMSMVGLNSGTTKFCNWLASSHKEDVQVNQNGIWVFDQSKIDGIHLANRFHGMNIPVRKQAYGQDVRQAMYQLPVSHTTEAHIPNILAFTQFAERASGATDPVQGSSAGDEQGHRTATELSIIARAAQGRFGLEAQLYDQQDGEDLVMQMIKNTKRFMSEAQTLRLTSDIAAQMKMNPRVNTHFTINPGDLDDVEATYVPFDPQQIVFQEKAADIKLQLLKLTMGIPELAQRFDRVGYLVSIAHKLGDMDFDRFIADEPGPNEMGAMTQPQPGQQARGAPPMAGRPALPPGPPSAYPAMPMAPGVMPPPMMPAAAYGNGGAPPMMVGAG